MKQSFTSRTVIIDSNAINGYWLDDCKCIVYRVMDNISSSYVFVERLNDLVIRDIVKRNISSSNIIYVIDLQLAEKHEHYPNEIWENAKLASAEDEEKYMNTYPELFI